MNTIKVKNIAELKTRKGTPESVVEILGYYTEGDGGGGTFYWNNSSTAIDDGGVVIQVTGIGTGRWIRKCEQIHIKYFGANTSLSNNSVFIQKAITAAQTEGKTLIIDGDVGEYLITSTLTISATITIIGDGDRLSRITGNNVSVFTINAAVNYIKIEGVRISLLTRYTDIATNNLIGISINGTTSNQCYWHTYRDIFIDGFKTGIQANGVWSTTFDNVKINFCYNGILSSELAANNNIINCKFTGIYSANSSGIKIGDATNQSEGWMITNNLVFGYFTGIYLYGVLNNIISNNIIDHAQDTGIFLRTSATAPCINNFISNNYIAISNQLGNTGNAGIWILNSLSTYDSTNTGTTITDNEILNYTGYTMNYGILAEGTYAKRNIIKGNKIKSTLFDIRLNDNSPVESIISGNILKSNGAYITGSSANTIYTDNIGIISSANSSIKTTHGRQTAYYSTTPPTAGVVGDIVWNETPASAGFVGWVCTVGGSTATWKTFGLIS